MKDKLFKINNVDFSSNKLNQLSLEQDYYNGTHLGNEVAFIQQCIKLLGRWALTKAL